MKHPFNRFAVRYLAAVLLGILALLLHGAVRGGPLAVLVPQAPSPWELSKLAFWPMLGSFALAGWLGRGCCPLRRDLPAVVLTPAVMTLLCWAVFALQWKGSTCLAVWTALLAVGCAAPVRTEKAAFWAVLAAALAGFYILLTYLPFYWGPFLDPRDVAAMATLPC